MPEQPSPTRIPAFDRALAATPTLFALIVGIVGLGFTIWGLVTLEPLRAVVGGILVTASLIAMAGGLHYLTLGRRGMTLRGRSSSRSP